MAYDDESNFLPFDDLTNIARLLESFGLTPENLTATRFMALVNATHRIIGERREGQITLPELAGGLREAGLGGVPFDTVARVADHVSKIDAKADPLANITLRDVQRIIGK